MEHNAQKKETQTPEFKANDGQVSVAIWVRESATEKGKAVFFDTLLTRNYRDKKGQWQSTSRLGQRDLLPASRLLEKAYDWVSEHRTDFSSNVQRSNRDDFLEVEF